MGRRGFAALQDFVAPRVILAHVEQRVSAAPRGSVAQLEVLDSAVPPDSAVQQDFVGHLVRVALLALMRERLTNT